MAHASASKKLAPAVAGVLAALVAAPAGARETGSDGVFYEGPESISSRPGGWVREPTRRTEEGSLPIDLGGYFWVDTGVMDRINNKPGQYDQYANYMQGRAVLSATFERPIGDYFGRARVEFLGLVNEFSKAQYEPHTLDAYAMFGHKTWDVQVGRFLPWEVYHRGSGIELFTAEEAGARDAPSLYWLDTGRAYFNEAGQAAAHFYPFKGLGFELSGVYGQQNTQNWTGLRPVVALRLGGFQAFAGYEFLDQKPQSEDVKVKQSSSGWAGRLQYEFSWLRVGVNYAAAEQEKIDIRGDVDTDYTGDRWSAGGFADLAFHEDHAVGVGYHHTEQDNRQGETNMHDQAFVSYTYRLPFEGAFVKAVYGYALGDLEDADLSGNPYFTNDMRSFRIRLAYDFE